MGDTSMRNVLLYNHGGCENRGCEAIVRSTSELLTKAGDIRISLTSLTPEFDKNAGLDRIDRIILPVNASLSPYRIINSIRDRMGMSREEEKTREYHPTISMGLRNDVCLAVGGDTYCYGPQEHMHFINKRLKKSGKRLVLWGCSVEPDSLHGELLEDFRQYDLIVARESITANAMEEAGLPVARWCDPAFTLRKEELPLPEGWSEGKTVGLNVSPLVLDKTKNRPAAEQAFCALVRYILETSDNAIALVPHVTWAHDSDLDALGAIKAQFADEPRVFLLPGNLNAMQLKGYISRLSMLVTARTHASIAAYSTAVPTLVIGYSVKARGIARDLYGSEEGHLIAAQELTGAEQLITAYNALDAKKQTERLILHNRLPSYMDGHEKIVERVFYG